MNDKTENMKKSKGRPMTKYSCRGRSKQAGAQTIHRAATLHCSNGDKVVWNHEMRPETDAERRTWKHDNDDDIGETMPGVRRQRK